MSGQAEQMEAQRLSIEEMETSLTALLASEQFDWMQVENSDFDLTDIDAGAGMLAVGGPDREEEAAVEATAPPASAPALAEPEAAESEQLEMDFDGLEADEALIDGRRRPGVPKELPDRIIQNNPGAVSAPPPEA